MIYLTHGKGKEVKLMQATTMNGIYNFLKNNKDKIENVKITRMTYKDFNEYEGYQWQVNVKVISKEGYKNKLIAIQTNSTYVDDFDLDEDGNIYNSDEHSSEENAKHETSFNELIKLNIEDWLVTALF